jgi:molybdate transport system substrate-binding protein
MSRHEMAERDDRPEENSFPGGRVRWFMGIIGLVAVVFGLFAGYGLVRPARTAAGDALVVAAASDLQFAFTEIGELFTKDTGQPVSFSFGSTGNLVHQIENGAPVDVFAAANVAYLDGLRAQGLIVADSQRLYALGRMVLAVNRAGGVRAGQLADLLRPNVTHVALANPGHAPYGLAAKQALMTAGLWEALEPKLVYGENVRQAMQFVQAGDAEAGLIALSVADVPELNHVLLDADLHEPLVQAMAVITGSPRETLARRFISIVNGSRGKKIMQNYGFLIPEQTVDTFEDAEAFRPRG